MTRMSWLRAGLLFFLSAANGLAVEKPRRLPSDELRNPESPSFVPCPFPKSRDQVIEDYVFMVKKKDQLLRSGQIHHESITPQDAVWEMQLALASPGASVRFGELLRARDDAVTSPYESRFVLEVIDPRTNLVMGYAILSDSGEPLMTVRFQNPAAKQRLRKEYEVRRLFAERFGHDRPLQSVDAVFVRGDFAGELPVWRVRTADMTFYLGNYDTIGGEIWYKVENSMPVPESTYWTCPSLDRLGEVAVFDRERRLIQTIQLPSGRKVVLDELNGFVHVLAAVQ